MQSTLPLVFLNQQTLLDKKVDKKVGQLCIEEKKIAYVKDEGYNLNTMTTTLKSIVSCDLLGLEESFQGTCFGDAFSKACQYVTTDEKVCKDLRYVLIQLDQRYLQKCITQPKKYGKGRQELGKACVNSRLSPWKLNTLVKTR